MRATYFSCKSVKFDVLRGCWRFCIRISWFCSLIFYCARRVCSHFWSKISDYRNHKCYSWVSQDPLESLILLCIKLMMLKSKYWCLLLWPMFPLLCGFKKKKNYNYNFKNKYCVYFVGFETQWCGLNFRSNKSLVRLQTSNMCCGWYFSWIFPANFACLSLVWSSNKSRIRVLITVKFLSFSGSFDVMDQKRMEFGEKLSFNRWKRSSECQDMAGSGLSGLNFGSFCRV